MKRKAAASNAILSVGRTGAALDHHRKASSENQIIELSVEEGNGKVPAVALTEGEKVELAECEGIIEEGLATFYEVGTALLRIQECRLYCPAYSSFKQYCQKRWNIGRSYAWRVMGAAERLKLLSGGDTLPRPVNEFQMRPFLKLAPEEFPGAWKKAVRTAKEGKVTTKIVQAVIRELLPGHQAGKKGKRSKAKGKWPGGHVLALLNEAKQQVEKGETDKALAALEGIEGLLFKS